MRTLLLLLFLLIEFSSAQERYLVTPNDDYIPLRKGESASAIMRARMQKHAQTISSTTICTNQALFGYP